MSKFNIGDRVRITAVHGLDWALVGREGVIIAETRCFPDGLAYNLKGEGIANTSHFLPRELQLVPEPAPKSILAEAEELINGARQSDYGHPLDNFAQTGRIWGAILGIPDVPPETVGLMMIGAKLSRETNVHKRDNLVDAAGYAGTVEKVLDEIKRRAEAGE